MESLQQRVLEFIRREGLIPAVDDAIAAGRSGRIVLVGVSGGPDSVCLLHVLNQLKASLDIKLHIVHLNHMLRGEASTEDARYVEQLCSSLGLPSTIEARNVDAYCKEHKLSLEEGAREVRYDFFARAAALTGAECIALGHTEDDQVETVLMHLVRGSGLTGLRGMAPVSYAGSRSGVKLRVVRPLLEVTRKQTEEYCLYHNLRPCSDVTNYSLDYARNRFRHEMLPLLRGVNSNVGAAIRRVTRTTADDLAFIESEVARVWNDAVYVNPIGITINTPTVVALHPALERHLLRRVVGEALGDIVDIEAVHIESMMDALRKPAGKRISLPRGMTFYVSYDVCLLVKNDVDVCHLPEIKGLHCLKVPGVTLLPGWRVQADIIEPGGRAGGFTACLDLDASGEELTVRRRKPGDRFQPLGMGGVKKLQDFMVDEKIPSTWRDRVPLVCSPEGVVWVVGWRISESVKVSESTQRVLRISFERVE